MSLNWLELALGWLAVLIGVGVAALSYYGGFIAPALAFVRAALNRTPQPRRQA